MYPLPCLDPLPPPSSLLFSPLRVGGCPTSIYCVPCTGNMLCCSGGDISSPFCLGGVPPSLSLSLSLSLSCRSCPGRARCYSGGAPPPSLPGCTLRKTAAWLGCTPPSPGCEGETCAAVCGVSPPPPWWLHKLSALCRSGGPRSSSLSSSCPRARGVPTVPFPCPCLPPIGARCPKDTL